MNLTKRVFNKLKREYFALRSKKYFKNYRQYNILSIDETIDYIIDNKASISRYGDGELEFMENMLGNTFQTYNKTIAKKLKIVSTIHKDDFVVCLPQALLSVDVFTDKDKRFWNNNLTIYLYLYRKYFSIDKLYGNANISRNYVGMKNKSNAKCYFDKIKLIWQDRDLIITEGEKSRLGIGNDLFNNSKSIKRIICPSINAYIVYDKILEVLKNKDKNSLVLLALGATATALAYDIYNLGFQTLDIGHIDVEYEWFLAGVTEKIILKNKYVNEVKDGNQVTTCNDKKYLSEIIEDLK